MLRTFLDQPQAPRPRGRAFLTSVGAHAALAALLLFFGPNALPPMPPVAMALPISLEELPPVEAAGGGSPEAAPAPAPPAPRRKLPVPVTAAVEHPLPQVAESEVAVPEPEEPPVETEPATTAAIVVPGAGNSAGSGVGEGSGAGAGPGEGFGAGARGVRRRREELSGRVIPDDRLQGPTGAERGLPYVSRDEATVLRTYDLFPRLPAAAWQGNHPYVVVLDVCVSEDGHVSEAALLAHRSPALDPLVLEAVRTWKYRPRLVGGQPGAFCHVVTIKYER